MTNEQLVTTRNSLSGSEAKVQHPDVGSLDLLLRSQSSKSAAILSKNATISLAHNTVPQSETPNWNLNLTSTSSLLIVAIHMLFLYQWNGRKRPKCSYFTIVQKRKLHLLGLAMLSHPPTKNHNSRSRPQTPSSPADQEGRDDSGTGSGNRETPQDWGGQVVSKARQLSTWALQSGFALLLYNSHIIWSCRSLEALYVLNQGKDTDDWQQLLNSNIQPQQYGRVLFALTGTALLLEFRLSFSLLKISRKLEGGSPITASLPIQAGGNSERNTNNNQMQQKILHRPVGSLTALSCALVCVFQHHFEFVPLQVIPFVDNRYLLFGFSIPAPLTSLICWILLGWLSYETTPIAPVLSGLASGSLWAIGLTSFLQDQYWGNSVVAAFALLCCLSIRASNNTNHDPSDNTPRATSQSTYIPCIDYVSPSYAGRNEPEDSTTVLSTAGSFEGDESSDDGASDATSYDSSHGSPETEAHRQESVVSNDLEMAPLLENDRNQTVRARRGVSIG